MDAYLISVNYELSIEEAARLGGYNFINRDITSENFPTKPDGMIEKKSITVELVHFNREISTDDALHELDKMGMRPAELRELLAFGQTYPDIQRKFPVIALGSFWQYRHSRYFPFLFSGGSERDLRMGEEYKDEGWGNLCRFAAVRK